jgi:hypothetical protein
MSTTTSVPLAGEQLAEHPHFTPWTNPVSGVVSYVLTERVAPVHLGSAACYQARVPKYRAE